MPRGKEKAQAHIYTHTQLTSKSFGVGLATSLGNGPCFLTFHPTGSLRKHASTKCLHAVENRPS